MDERKLKFSVGLEVHARLNTERKIFCGCFNRFGDAPNANTCPVCLGLPGSLPVFNPRVLEPAVITAVALGCSPARISEFSRKNYFYPDLPRNYQITQYERPLAVGGSLQCSARNTRIKVHLQRIHLEEDAGRSIHPAGQKSWVDFNRAGSPLMELVTEPDLPDGESARAWLVELRRLLRWLEVCDGDMEKGSLRCDANVGLSGPGDLCGPWVELKNLNSFKAVAQAVDFEIQRLGNKLRQGEKLRRETRAWNPSAKSTSLLRIKESVSEYRYFPDPDLPLLELPSALLEKVKWQLGELPQTRRERFISKFALSSETADTMCRSKMVAEYFEDSVEAAMEGGLAPDEMGPLVANWILGPVLRKIAGNDSLLPELLLGPRDLGKIVEMSATGRINRPQTTKMIDHVLTHGSDHGISFIVGEVCPEKGVSGENLEELCERVLATHDAQLNSFLRGKKGLMNFFVGWVMSRAGEFADAQKVREMLQEKLNKEEKK